MFVGITKISNFLWRFDLIGGRVLPLRSFTITLRHTTFGSTPLDEGSARRRGVYLTTHITHMRQTSMISAGFEPTIAASGRLQTHAIDLAATGIGTSRVIQN